MAWDPTGNTIFYNSELSLNTEYSISTNVVYFNAAVASNSVGIEASIGKFNISLEINSMNSEVYTSNISTNAVTFNAYTTYKSYSSSESAAVVDTDTQVWIG